MRANFETVSLNFTVGEAVPWEPFQTRYNTSSSSPFSVVKVDDVPESFLQGLADCEAGRMVDLDTALNEPPSDQ